VQASHKVSAVFDDPNLIGSAGLVPVMRLAERAGLHELLEQHLSVASPNAGLKAAGVLAGMLSGADSIDLCRHRDYADKVGLAAAETQVRTRFRC